MSLKTRLDGRSDVNSSFTIKNEQGEVLAIIKAVTPVSVTLDIDTAKGLYIEKPSGWCSKKD